MSWQLMDYNGDNPKTVDIASRLIFPTGSHNLSPQTGEADCMRIADRSDVTELIDDPELAMQIVIAAPYRALTLAEMIKASEHSVSPIEAAIRIETLGREAVLFCNTTRTKTVGDAIRSAHDGSEMGIRNIKLEVVRPVYWKERKTYLQLPNNSLVVDAAKILIQDGFNVAPIIACHPLAIGDTLDVARELVGIGANAIRLCVGDVGQDNGILHRPDMLALATDQIKAFAKYWRTDINDFPVIAEGGMSPWSIPVALRCGVNAVLVNHFVVSHIMHKSPLEAARSCLKAVRAYEAEPKLNW